MPVYTLGPAAQISPFARQRAWGGGAGALSPQLQQLRQATVQSLSPQRQAVARDMLQLRQSAAPQAQQAALMQLQQDRATLQAARQAAWANFRAQQQQGIPNTPQPPYAQPIGYAAPPVSYAVPQPGAFAMPQQTTYGAPPVAYTVPQPGYYAPQPQPLPGQATWAPPRY